MSTKVENHNRDSSNGYNLTHCFDNWSGTEKSNSVISMKGVNGRRKMAESEFHCQKLSP